jgi:diguanylate cyclase (GGDEF)-like protein
VPGCNRLVTLSVGITPYHDDDTLEELLSRADEQLYRAKAEGRDRVVAAPGTAPSRRPNAG